MASIKVRPLRDDLPFGARVAGVTQDTLKDAAIRKQIDDVFWDRGMILFEGVEPSSTMQVEISNIFGPLKEHPVKTVGRVDRDALPGVIEIKADPSRNPVVEVEGKSLVGWQPWHFDHCYMNELNRAGVLRPVTVPPEGGLTGFADGVQVYNAIPPAMREKIEGKNIIYTLDLLYAHMRFGKPKNFREIKPPITDILDVAKTLPRAIHPAVWTRKTGEKVMHVSPWMAVGIEGQENPAGDAFFEELCQAIVAKLQPYIHQWKPDEMIAWDNWRMLHRGMGADPKYARLLHRTTVKGDYGLGYFENRAKTSDAPLEMM